MTGYTFWTLEKYTSDSASWFLTIAPSIADRTFMADIRVWRDHGSEHHS